MSESSRSPRARFIAALNVRRNAVRGFAFGAVLAVAMLVVFVLVPGTTRSTALYVGLTVVLATSAGALVTVFLTVLSAYRLARET
jgi:hypothetical protein